MLYYIIDSKNHLIYNNNNKKIVLKIKNFS